MQRTRNLLLTLLWVAAAACGSGQDETGQPDAAPVADASGELLTFMTACETNEQCETGLCFNFNSKGPHCTTSCIAPTDCAAPSPGCNNKGVCKAPD